MKKLIFTILFISAGFAAFSAGVNVTVDYGNNLHPYMRDLAFGTNVLGEWSNFKYYRDNVYRFQQAGTRFLRFPGGSNSNEYHWNGNGYYDADKIWNINGSPNVTTFQRGFYNLALHRGSLSKGYGKWAVVTDNDPATYWLSYPDDPQAQWIYIEIQDASYNPVQVNRIVIDWGTPYAASYKIQYSNGNWNGMGQWMYNDTAWLDTSAGVITSGGGHADISFTGVSAKYVRVLCMTSSDAHNQYAINEIKLYNTALQVTKNQANVNQSPSVSSSVALGDRKEIDDSVDFEQFMSFCKSMTPSAEPLITINYFTGTTQEAADWVHYANNERHYNIKYWEIGNENAGTWEAGGPSQPEAYAARFIAFYDAMIAEDNSITISPQFNSITDVCNVTMTAGNNAGAHDWYIDTFLKYLADHGKAGILKGLSVHRYPTWQPASEAVPLGQVNIWDSEMPMLKAWVNSRCSNPGEVKFWVTEFNDGIDSGFTNHFYNSLFISSFMLNFIKNGGDQLCYFTTFGTPGPGQTDLTIFSDFGFLEGGGLGGALSDKMYQPRASFYALEMMYNDFSAADDFGNTIIAASSDNSALKVYANKRGDRKLSLMLINTDQSNTMTANISLTGFTPLPSAEVVSYSRQQYSWVANGSQSYADPDNPPQVSLLGGAGANFTCDVGPYSIKLITMYDGAQATLAPSSTPTMLPTATITPTPFPNGGALLDNCEDGDLKNFWGGDWSIYGDGVSSYPATIPAMTCDGLTGDGSNCYMKITGTVALSTWGYGVNCPLNPSWAGTNISQYDGIFFYYKGDGASPRLAFPQTSMPDANYGVNIAGATTWTFYQIPFTSLTHSAWGVTYGAWTATDIQAVQLQPSDGYGGAAYRELDWDQIGFYKNTRTSTITPTITATSTMTPTITITDTPGIPPTGTVTPTATETLTITPTMTPTAPASAATDLANVYVYPAAFNASSGLDSICFYNLTSHTKIAIYNLKAELVAKFEQDTPSGTFCWKVMGLRKSKTTAPGVYVYIISNDMGEIRKGKLTIVR